jgi:pimeloyl-ACP methyl ester carboxylesterase
MTLLIVTEGSKVGEAGGNDHRNRGNAKQNRRAAKRGHARSLRACLLLSMLWLAVSTTRPLIVIMLTRRSLAMLPVSAAYAQYLVPLPSGFDKYAEPLGIGMEGWPYPAEVRFFALTMLGQAVRMAYMDVRPTGAANGRAVVLLHGKNFDSSYWSGPIAWLTQAGFRVVVPDQIGFNKSSKPDLDYTFEGLSANTVALLDELQLRTVILVGHSTGGMLAVRMATAYPERIEKLVLEDPIGLVDYREFIPPQTTETLVEAERRYTVETYRAFIARYFPRLPAAQYEPFVEWRMRMTRSGEFERYARAAALTYQMIYREPVRDLYRTLPMPVLLFAGSEDRSFPLIQYAPPEARGRLTMIPAAAKSAAAELRQGQLVSVPNVGHVPHLEAPDTFREALMKFVA